MTEGNTTLINWNVWIKVPGKHNIFIKLTTSRVTGGKPWIWVFGQFLVSFQQMWYLQEPSHPLDGNFPIQQE